MNINLWRRLNHNIKIKKAIFFIDNKHHRESTSRNAHTDILVKQITTTFTIYAYFTSQG